VNPAGVSSAGARAAQLILELAGGTLTNLRSTPRALLPPLEWSVALRYERCAICSHSVDERRNRCAADQARLERISAMRKARPGGCRPFVAISVAMSI